MATKTATKSASKRSAPTRETTTSKTQARKGLPTPGVTAEATPLPVDKAHKEAEEQREELQQPGRVAKGLGDQIDNDPGYDKDQLAHMAEYWGEEERDEPGK